MANPEHVAVARRSTHAIARWREEHWRGRARLDLSGAYLSGAKLPGVDLSYDDLSHIDLTSADLHGARLSGTNFESGHLSRSNLAWSNLSNAKLTGVTLVRCNLRGTCLQGADLQGSDLSYADLSHADLTGANLSGCDLSHANLRQADLTGAHLSHTTLTRTALDIANLSGVDLRHASLVRVTLDGALFSEVRLEMTIFGDCDLSQVLCLESAIHSGPSLVGLDTLARSRGAIPLGFLSDAGVSTAFINLQQELSLTPRDSSRVLLVASIEDASFVDQLRSDLVAAGTACWQVRVDDEEAQVHDGIAPPLEQLTYYDQMVLVCSESSLEGLYGWRFFDQILQLQIPGSYRWRGVVSVSLDRTLMTKQDGLCEQLRSQAMVDFADWRQPAAYRRCLDRLIALLGEELEPRPVSSQPRSPARD